jgi:rod shape-determining protein MreC
LSHIDKLELENLNLEIYKTLYQQQKNQLNEYTQNQKDDKQLKDQYLKVRSISYYKLNDFSRVVLDVDLPDKEKIYALVTLDGHSAGIALHKYNKTIAYLNSNKRCNYTVYMGTNKTPGITSGMTDDGNLLIKYVPIWKKVNINDKVITSSMDTLFPYGINVGNVVSIDVKENTQEISVKPLFNFSESRNYYLYLNNIKDLNDSNQSLN